MTNEIFRVAVVGQFSGASQIVNTYHFKNLGTGSGSVAAERLYEALMADFVPLYVAMLSSAYVGQSIQIRDVTNPLSGFDGAFSAAGSNVGDFLPPQVAVEVISYNGLIGRRNRNKQYLPAPPEAVVSGGTLIQDYVDQIESNYANFFLVTDPSTTDTFQLFTWSDTYSVGQPVTTVKAWPQTRIQNRRRFGSGS